MIISYLSVRQFVRASVIFSHFQHFIQNHLSKLIKPCKIMLNVQLLELIQIQLLADILKCIPGMTLCLNLILHFFLIQSYQYSWLVVWGFPSHSRIFLSFENVTITVVGLQILTYAWHSWPLSCEGYLTCHTY